MASTTNLVATISRLSSNLLLNSICAALLLLAGAPFAFSQEQAFELVASEGLHDLASQEMDTVRSALIEARQWTGLPANHQEFTIEWVATRQDLAAALGRDISSWFAAVAIPGQRRMVIATEVAGSRTQLRATMRHELMHLAMTDLGAAGWSKLPSWFHEGCAQVFAGDIYLREQNSSVGWLLSAGELPPLADYRKGFPSDSFGASLGYHLAHGFVDRLIRIYGLPSLRDVLALVRHGSDLDTALIEVTGLSIVSHEKELRRELSGFAGMGGDMYGRLFLGLSVFIILSFPIVRATKRRRRKLLEKRWQEQDDFANENEDE